MVFVIVSVVGTEVLAAVHLSLSQYLNNAIKERSLRNRVLLYVPKIVKKIKHTHTVYVHKNDNRESDKHYKGKVVHQHHHSGKVEHIHKHSGKAKHEHDHHGYGDHKHEHLGKAQHKHKHHGLSAHSHKHAGEAAHSHKHKGQAEHAHGHTGKGQHMHDHTGHASHGHKHTGLGSHKHQHDGSAHHWHKHNGDAKHHHKYDDTDHHGDHHHGDKTEDDSFLSLYFQQYDDDDNENSKDNEQDMDGQRLHVFISPKKNYYRFYFPDESLEQTNDEAETDLTDSRDVALSDKDSKERKMDINDDLKSGFIKKKHCRFYISSKVCIQTIPV